MLVIKVFWYVIKLSIAFNNQYLLNAYQVNHPDVVESAKKIIKDVRAAGAIVSSVAAQGILLAVIMKQTPEILTKKFPNGSSFHASDNFVCKWL